MREDPSICIRTEALTKSVQSGNSEITILQELNLSIKRGERVAILGASGSGKTTLLTLLAGLDLPSSGNIYLEGQALNKLNEEQRAKLRGQYIGFIFQAFYLLPSLTALENVMLPLELHAMSYKQCKIAAIEMLNQVGLSERLHHYPAQLSGGEQQRVAIARAFVTKPAIILADEMTGNLDTHTGEHVANILFNLNKNEKTTLVLVTHDAALAARCERQLMLSDRGLTAC